MTVTGTLTITSGYTLSGGSVTVASSGTLDFNCYGSLGSIVLTVDGGTLDSPYELSVGSGATLDCTGGSVSVPAGLFIDSGGTLNCAGTIIDGTLNIYYGTATISGSTTIEAFNSSAGTAAISGSTTIGTFTLSGGTVTDTDTVTVTGTYSLSGGTLVVNSGALFDLTSSGSFNGGVLELAGGTVEATTGLDIGSGATLAGAGTIDGSVDLDNFGYISLGAPYSRGALVITGTFTQASYGSLNVKLDSQTITDGDQLQIDGTASLSGQFTATLASGYTPTSGDVFELLESSGITGSFGNISLPTYGGGHLSSATIGSDFELTAS